MALRVTSSQGTSLFSKNPVQVIVGSGKSLYYVHPDVLSGSSSALNARINGPWRTNEAKESIDWTDFDAETVECVLSYLYTQDYHVPQWMPDKDEFQNANHSQEIELIVPTNANSSAEPTLGRPLTPLSRCISVGLPADTIRTAAGYFTEAKSQNLNGIGRAILIHAKVYCFAHRFLLSDLEDFALQRLTQVLLACDASDSLMPQIAEAIRLVYDSTPSATVQDNPARKLLSQYTALRYTTISNENMDGLIAEGGEFVIDLFHKVARTMDVSFGSLRSLEEELDGLQVKLNSLMAEYQTKEDQIKKAKAEIAEWESWNRGIPRMYKKLGRKVSQLDRGIVAAFEGI